MKAKLVSFHCVKNIFYDPNYDDEPLDRKDPKIKRLKELVRVFIDTELTKRQKACLTMWFFEGKSAEKIADALGIKPTTVYKHIREAKKKIKKCWNYL